MIGVVEYFTTPTRTLVFGVRADRDQPLVREVRFGEEPVCRDDLLARADRLLIDFHGLPHDWETSKHANRIRRALALSPAVHAAKRAQPALQRNLRKAAFAYTLDYWQELSEALLPADLRDWLQGCELLCIVPHGPLHSLPLGALNWSQDGNLIDRAGLCTVPSASVLRSCRAKNRARREPGHRPRSCLIAAVAAADDQDPGDFEADGAALARIFAAHADSRVTQLVGAAPQGGRRPASKELISSELGGHDVVHLACHGIYDVDPDDTAPLDHAGLLVSDGATTVALTELPNMSPTDRAPWLLSAREVLAARLQADLVTLRACSSGRAELGSGDELLGLTRAFLYAGTPSLIATLWNVHKRSSQRLLSDFYELWIGERLPKWRALQTAQQRLRADPEYSHPYHWAPFVLVGDWL